MIIGIEAERANLDKKTGVEHYAKQLILHLAEIDAANSYVLYLRTSPEEWFTRLPKNFKVKVMPFPLFWTQLRLSWELLWHPVDALLIPASAMPLIHPRRSFVTIHDLAWKFYPRTFTWFMRSFLEWSTGFAVRSAQKVIAVSEATKKDLIGFYNVAAEKVAVVHHGYEHPAASIQEDKYTGYRRRDEVDETRSEAGRTVLPEKYVLFLSTLQPRKNLEGLIDAFAQLKAEQPELPHKLVVVGKPGWKFEGILEKISCHKDNVVYLNHVSDKEKAVILRQADLLVQPSFYEGFGMQILEAFAAGVPVATSKVSSMPEVAGEAAIYFDPKSAVEIKNSIKQVLADRSLRDNLVFKGRERLKHFSWKKCAQETLKVLSE